MLSDFLISFFCLFSLQCRHYVKKLLFIKRSYCKFSKVFFGKKVHGSHMFLNYHDISLKNNGTLNVLILTTYNFSASCFTTWRRMCWYYRIFLLARVFPLEVENANVVGGVSTAQSVSLLIVLHGLVQVALLGLRMPAYCVKGVRVSLVWINTIRSSVSGGRRLNPISLNSVVKL